jgi:hypothetical protein
MGKQQIGRRKVTIEERLAEQIRFELYWRKWDLPELAERLKGSGIHYAYLEKLLGQHPDQPPRRMVVKDLCSFAKVLDMSVDELLNLSTDPAESSKRNRILAIVEELRDLTLGRTEPVSAEDDDDSPAMA